MLLDISTSQLLPSCVPQGITAIPPGEGIESYRHVPISRLLPYFALYVRHEWQLGTETTSVYVRNLTTIIRVLGDVTPQEISVRYVGDLKAHAFSRNAGSCRLISLIAALKAFLRFCREALELPVLDAKDFRGPRVPRREVVFLRPEEVRQFVDTILAPRTGSRAKLGDLERLCFRAMVEAILGTGMRLSEALSLTRSNVNLETGEARVIGKGNKERTVFFTVRARDWVKSYLAERKDAQESIFLDTWGRPVARHTAILWFRRFWRLSGVRKKITAHVLRHTVATTLLFNGCPISHVKEILGHERLQTTCTYYLGADKRAAKEAYLRCLRYEIPSKAEAGSSAYPIA